MAFWTRCSKKRLSSRQPSPRRHNLRRLSHAHRFTRAVPHQHQPFARSALNDIQHQRSRMAGIPGNVADRAAAHHDAPRVHVSGQQGQLRVLVGESPRQTRQHLGRFRFQIRDLLAQRNDRRGGRHGARLRRELRVVPKVRRDVGRGVRSRPCSGCARRRGCACRAPRSDRRRAARQHVQVENRLSLPGHRRSDDRLHLPAQAAAGGARHAAHRPADPAERAIPSCRRTTATRRAHGGVQ